jgi:DNA-binding beta-propeller fold protein YncE
MNRVLPFTTGALIGRACQARIMRTGPRTHKTNALRWLGAVALAGLLATPVVAQRATSRPASRVGARGPAATPRVAPPTATYWIYVGAESADRIHRIRFGPQGAVVEKTIGIGEMAAEMEGPHGLQVSPDGKFLFMTTGHGFPDGKLWKYELGPDTLVAPGILLGKFPASLDLTPDGAYSFSANFNLHGEMVPSSISVVQTSTMTEVAQIETCTMPHGSRIDPSGAFHYSGCMMDDQLVEIDTRSFAVARRFSLAKGKEGPVTTAAASHAGHQMDHSAGHGASMSASCSPTWAQPSANGREIFVACNKADEIVAVDRERWAVSRRMPTGRGVYNLATTPDGEMLVATLKQGAAIELFDLTRGVSVARIPTSTTVAHGVAVSSDSRYAFVSSEGVGAAPGKVDIIDLRARTKVATVDVSQQASGITFWKQDGR